MKTILKGGNDHEKTWLFWIAYRFYIGICNWRLMVSLAINPIFEK